jgi:hypothetical protein
LTLAEDGGLLDTLVVVVAVEIAVAVDPFLWGTNLVGAGAVLFALGVLVNFLPLSQTLFTRFLADERKPNLGLAGV